MKTTPSLSLSLECVRTTLLCVQKLHPQIMFVSTFSLYWSVLAGRMPHDQTTTRNEDFLIVSVQNNLNCSWLWCSDQPPIHQYWGTCPPHFGFLDFRSFAWRSATQSSVWCPLERQKRGRRPPRCGRVGLVPWRAEVCGDFLGFSCFVVYQTVSAEWDGTEIWLNGWLIRAS